MATRRAGADRANVTRHGVGGRYAGEVCGLMLIGAVASGCAAPAGPADGWNGPVCFPDAASVPRVVVQGDLRRLLPQYDATPTIERFLYGPNDFGKTALRNPQGMARLGDRLLVCDQGQPAVIAIDLATGMSMPWGDPDHVPRCPVDVAVAEANGLVFVADTTLRSVLAYGEDGGYTDELTPTRDPARRFRPCAVCVHGDVLYVGNPGDRQIDRWHLADARWLEPFRPPAGVPGLVAPTGICATGDDVLLIADAIRGQVRRVTVDGRWLEPIGTPGRADGQFVRPKQVCWTPGGLVLVSDAARQSVLVFHDDGRYVTEIHERGDAWHGWTLPAGLIALKPADLAGDADAESGDTGPPAPDAHVILSDSLGGIPLTLMDVVVRQEVSSGHAARR